MRSSLKKGSDIMSKTDNVKGYKDNKNNKLTDIDLLYTFSKSFIYNDFRRFRSCTFLIKNIKNS